MLDRRSFHSCSHWKMLHRLTGRETLNEMGCCLSALTPAQAVYTPRDTEPETDKICPNIPEHVVVKCWDQVQRFRFWRQLLIHDSLSAVVKHLKLKICMQRSLHAQGWLQCFCECVCAWFWSLWTLRHTVNSPVGVAPV